MRNKPYVIGILVFAVLLACLAIRGYMGDGGLLFVIPPALLAAALFAGAAKVARSDSFAPSNLSRWNSSGEASSGVKSWLKDKSGRPPGR